MIFLRALTSLRPSASLSSRGTSFHLAFAAALALALRSSLVNDARDFFPSATAAGSFLLAMSSAYTASGYLTCERKHDLPAFIAVTEALDVPTFARVAWSCGPDPATRRIDR